MKISKHNESLLTADYLRSQLTYKPEEGVFRWKVSNSNKITVGDVAGNLNSHSGYRYINITISGKHCRFMAHRLAWLYIYGVWPKDHVDHIDRDNSNNRIGNLREATLLENQYNKTKQKSVNGKTLTSSFIGVSWCKRHLKWRSYIRNNKKMRSLVLYKFETDAALAYNAAAIARDPNFNNLNSIPENAI